ncbi:MAG: class I SAM-dependent methyltransferase [Polaribacter sp.]|jgi:SAM-dependent methyltransferase
MDSTLKKHWENVYQNKTPEQVSWTQKFPKTSLDLIAQFDVDLSSKIIDVGGGDSHLVDFLIDEGYENISVLDISSKAIERAKDRLADKEQNIHWIISNILDFMPETKYDVWHDRAAFHFLTSKKDIESYVKIVSQFANHIVLGTFSKNGPLKCSGLPISQYNAEDLQALLKSDFELVSSHYEDHTTPFDTQQNFLFCSFRRKTI